MSADSTIRRQIAETLRRASDPQLLRIMTYIDRLPVRRRVDDLVAHVRDRLATVRPPRPLSLTRVLALPFADLLAEATLAAASPWLVPRPLLSTLHGLLPRLLPASLLAGLEALAEDRTLDDRETVQEMGAVLWPTVAAALGVFLATPAKAAAASPLQPFRARLPMLIDILSHGSDIVRALDQVPARPIGRWLPAEYQAARGLLGTARGVSEALLRACCMMLVRRSAMPDEIFALAADRDLNLPSLLRHQLLEDASLGCLVEAETMSDHMAQAGDITAMAAARTAQRLAVLVASLEQAPPGAAVTGKRLGVVRARACAAITEAFKHTLETDLPRAASLLGGTSPARDEDVLAAEGLARSIRKIELAGARLGLGRHLDETLHGKIGDCTKRVSSKLRTLAGAPGEQLATVMDDLRFIEILFGAEAAMTLLPASLRLPTSA